MGRGRRPGPTREKIGPYYGPKLPWSVKVPTFADLHRDFRVLAVVEGHDDDGDPHIEVWLAAGFANVHNTDMHKVEGRTRQGVLREFNKRVWTCGCLRRCATKWTPEGVTR